MLGDGRKHVACGKQLKSYHTGRRSCDKCLVWVVSRVKNVIC